MRRFLVGSVVVVGLISTNLCAAADEADSEGVRFFEKKIRPVLVQSCYKCHSADAKSPKGGLLVDSKAAIRAGGETGPAVMPGDVDSSLLITALRHEDLEMPPKGKLSEAVINDFVKWVKMGAPDPRGGDVVAKPVEKKIDWVKAKEFWSFKPPVKATPPAVKNESWPRTDIDRFVLAGIEKQGLNPVADADDVALMRRLHFDLAGLPPTPAQIDQFQTAAAENLQSALENLVDQLLDSPQFGERWGRHWLDVARYAESNGNVDNTPFPHAWRYRNYVIDALNDDRPYDQFITEQIAGDLLPFKTPRQRNQQHIATGFLALGSKPRAQNNPNYRMDIVAEQIEVTTSAVLGLTVMCARCHDHKFDPIPTAEYYSLAGIFTSTDTLYGSGGRKNRAPTTGVVSLVAEDPKLTEAVTRHEKLLAQKTAEKKQLVAKLAELGVKTQYDPKNANRIKKFRQQLDRLVAKNANPKQIEAVKKRLNQLGVDVDEKTKPPAKSESARDTDIRKLKNELKIVEKDLRMLADKAPQPAGVAMGVREGKAPADCQICVRGESTNRAESVSRGFITVATQGDAPQIEAKESGRLELAKWITDGNNPLTARVMVNRIWYHLFGRGIVSSLDNFGQLGERPTHPELLDYLAVKFVDENWSLKKMIRTIVLTRAYQMGSDHDESNYAKDPDNIWRWRMSPRRLDAESLRDAILAVSGDLNLDRPGPMPVNVNTRQAVQGMSKDLANRRSVYLTIIRNQVPESLGLFDFADPSIVVGQRDITTVPAQSLYLMNSPFVVTQSKLMAQRLLEKDAAGNMKDDHQIVEEAYLLAFARRPTSEQSARAVDYVHRSAESLGENKTAQESAWASFCQSLLAAAELRYLD